MLKKHVPNILCRNKLLFSNTEEKPRSFISLVQLKIAPKKSEKSFLAREKKHRNEHAKHLSFACRELETEVSEKANEKAGNAHE